MIRLITLFMATLLSTQAAFAMNCKFNERNQTGDPVLDEMFSDATMARVENSMYKHIPMGKFISQTPKRYRDIVFNDQDVPLTEVDKQAERSVKYWGQPLSANAVQYFQIHNFDWTTYQQLNQEAQSIWADMKACNQTNLQDLRKNYFMTKLCPNPAAGEGLLKRLQDLSTNFFQFLDTSALIVQKTNPMPYSLIDPDFILPNQHPLLYQIALQTWAIMLNLANEKQRADTISLEGALREYYSFLAPRMLSEPIRYYGEGRANWAKDHYNLVLMLAGQDENCAALGLWPAMNRALIYVDDFSYNTMGSIGTTLRRGGDKFEKACGMKIDPTRATPGTYHAYAVAHIFESKRLFLSYFPDLPGSKTMLNLVKKNTKLIPFEKFVCE